MTATDELHRDGVVSDETWTTLQQWLDDRQLIELIALVGCYATMGWLQSSLRVAYGDDGDVTRGASERFHQDAASIGRYREHSQSVAERYVEAVENGDAGTLAGLLAPHATAWSVVDGIERSREEHIAAIATVRRAVTQLRFDDVRRTTRPGGYVQEHVVALTFADGFVAEVPGCYVVETTGEVITAMGEYANSAATRPVIERVAPSH